MPYDYEHIQVSVEDYIAVVRLNRPEKMNAFNANMGLELLRLPGELRDDPDVRVVIITGNGRGFCGGADVAEGRAHDGSNPFHRTAMDELGYSGRLPLAWVELDKPTIAAVNGVAAGGGLCLAIMQDIRVLGKSARMLPMFSRRGLAPEVGASWFLANIMGSSRAIEWLLTNEDVRGERAMELGLGSYLVEDDQLMDKAMEVARNIADAAPIAARLTRRSVYHALSHSLRDHLPYEAANLGISQNTEDAVEGRTATRERRKANFKGR